MFYLSYTRNNSNQLLQCFWGKKDAVIRLKLCLVTYDTKKHLLCCNMKNKIPCWQNNYLLYKIMCLGCSGNYIGKQKDLWYQIWTGIVNTIKLFRSDLQQLSLQLQQIGGAGEHCKLLNWGLGTKKSKSKKMM